MSRLRDLYATFTSSFLRPCHSIWLHLPGLLRPAEQGMACDHPLGGRIRRLIMMILCKHVSGLATPQWIPKVDHQKWQQCSTL